MKNKQIRKAKSKTIQCLEIKNRITKPKNNSGAEGLH